LRVAVILAGGRSRRFGKGDKLTSRLWGRPLIEHALDRARESGAHRLILVVGGRVLVRSGPRLTVIRSRSSAEGMGGSLRAALRHVRPVEREVLVFLADMPFAHAGATLRIPPGAQAVRPVFRGLPGHPLLVRAAALSEVSLSGDRGLAGALDRRRIASVEGDAGNVLDIDTRVALRRVRMDHAGRRRVGRRGRQGA
jgi:CTP:molybdopterin cytidylyltransferase MocA